MVGIYEILEIDTCSMHMIFTGHEPADEYRVLFRRYFRKRDTKPTYNLHIFETGNPEIEHILLFRKYLYANPSLMHNVCFLKNPACKAISIKFRCL